MEKIDSFIKDALQEVPERDGRIDERIMQKCSVQSGRKSPAVSSQKLELAATIVAVAVLAVLLTAFFFKNSDKGGKVKNETIAELSQENSVGVSGSGQYELKTVLADQNCRYIERTNLNSVLECWVYAGDYSFYSGCSPYGHYEYEDSVQNYRVFLNQMLANTYFCAMDADNQKLLLKTLEKMSDQSHLDYVREAAKLVHDDLENERIVIILNKKDESNNKLHWFYCEPEKLDYENNYAETELNSYDNADVKIRLKIKRKMNGRRYWYDYTELE